MTTPVTMVSLDGSEKDGRALAVAAALADISGDDLYLVRVFEYGTTTRSARAGALGVTDAAMELRENASRQTRDAGSPGIYSKRWMWPERLRSTRSNETFASW
jgi:hypothetical protein